jgi:hypothetical protein
MAATARKPDGPMTLLLGLSLPAILCTRGEIITFGHAAWFIPLNAAAIMLIVALAYIRDQNAAKRQQFLKNP